MVIEEKLVKHCEVGELDFYLGINRSMSIDGYKKYPQYWETINKSETVRKAAKSDNGVDVDSSNIIELMELTDKLMEYAADIVVYLLPKMLEYADKNELPANLSDYNEYAECIIDYCDENDVLFDYYDEETDETVKGFINTVMEFIQLGFTNGGEKKKGKVKISLN